MQPKNCTILKKSKQELFPCQTFILLTGKVKNTDSLFYQTVFRSCPLKYWLLQAGVSMLINRSDSTNLVVQARGLKFTNCSISQRTVLRQGLKRQSITTKESSCFLLWEELSKSEEVNSSLLFHTSWLMVTCCLKYIYMYDICTCFLFCAFVTSIFIETDYSIFFLLTASRGIAQF
ncbi:hypothetical protein B6A09_1190 [Saccharomyces cerevisiae synthetic construct]|uniref:Putative uncharacterized protein YBR116C n=1 Tax=Saccharomyces cerevisiae (strain ATCC 204508 / S288c) TaxID=559292 RepID=YBW6_YEAST|nr:RecName: Full=Putative uncharacterized protein YBR116C [Saccharomyces cerevisiae S288C]AAT93278.1 YBR116C [Saccharomyces cerevisiae]ARB01913.1 hypothetical protein B6A09_1190 [Saccharomyces cerevisiae synthetic construct]WNV72009.1 hypothetical protein O6U65_0253 [Saccharomyces cerevisiae synthetic construct]CAA55618.1 YBR0911 [Saccharomyces cerevisiae]CAA85073.1 unnamed protein product [Saccharomyces cerevisiae]